MGQERVVCFFPNLRELNGEESSYKRNVDYEKSERTIASENFSKMPVREA